MRYAETGYNLEVDLSRGNIERVETDPKLAELYLGGHGTNAKILWDRVTPDIQPFDPENLLIISAGLLNGSPVPGANRACVTSLSPQTNMHYHSLFGGHFGAELKYAGYDKIIFTGKSPTLVYLYINNDKVELRDASHLKGKGAIETEALLKEELKLPKAKVACVGLAGENQVYFASIESGGSSASRGMGAIMGSKNLKAIVVRGTKDLNFAHPGELFEYSLKMHKDIANNPNCGCIIKEHGTNQAWHTDNFAWGNARTRRPGFWNPEIEEKWKAIDDSVRLRWKGCYNCPLNCYQVVSYPGRPVFIQKCWSKLGYATSSFSDLDFSFDFLGVALEHGLDNFTAPQVFAFACELYNDGVLTDKDLPDFPKNGGERFFYLMDMIVNRRGVGDILAKGTYFAAREIPGAEKYEHNTIKGIEQVPLKLGRVNPTFFVMYATNEKLTITQIEGSFPQVPQRTPERRQKFVERWHAAPNDRLKEIYLNWTMENRLDLPPDEVSLIVEWNETMHYIDDSIGTCGFLSSFRGQFGGTPPYHSHNLPEIIHYAHGMEIDKNSLWEKAHRNRTLVRAFNNRRGMRRKDERPPEDHWKYRDEELEQKFLSYYYYYRGWSQDGIPTKETLERFGLDYVKDEFEKMGILTSYTEAEIDEINKLLISDKEDKEEKVDAKSSS